MNTSIDNKITKLIIKGLVIATPGKLRKKIGQLDSDINNVNFRDIFMGSTQSKKIKIHNTTEDTIYISYPQKNLGIEFNIEPYGLSPAGYGELILHFDTKNHNYGKISEEILLHTKVNDKIILGKIYLHANIIEDFSTLSAEELAASPQISIKNKIITLKNLKQGELRTEKIEIENLGISNLHIRNIQTYRKEFTVEPTSLVVKAGSKNSFYVSITTPQHSPKIKTSITVISNDPDNSVVNITIMGEVDIPEGDKARSMVNEVSIEKAKSVLNSFKGQEDFVILDVRTEDEYNRGCIEGAVNLDVEKPDFIKMLKLLNTKKKYLIYCKSGIRSKLAVDLMSKMDFVNVYHMYEGIDGWMAERLELKDPNNLLFINKKLK